jgi:hypothetical protein
VVQHLCQALLSRNARDPKPAPVSQ